MPAEAGTHARFRVANDCDWEWLLKLAWTPACAGVTV